MKVGYARISTDDQKLDLQSDALQGEGCSKVYKDIASGGKAERKGLFDAIKFMRKGDTLVVWKLDRLGRDLKHLIHVTDDLRKRDIGFKVLTGQGANIDTTTANGKLIFGIFASLAEFERELISERTMAGLQAARARGRLGGRPRKMDKHTLKMAMSAMSDKNSVASAVAKRLGITTATLYTHVNSDGSLKEKGAKIMQK